MSQRKVGALDHPSRYGARTKGVFMRAAGFFFLDDGRRVAVGGTQRWTTTEGIAMRGNAPHVPPMQAILQLERPSTPLLGAIEADELELAIAESLATAPEAPVAVAEAPAEAIADEGGAPPDAPEPRRCVV